MSICFNIKLYNFISKVYEIKIICWMILLYSTDLKSLRSDLVCLLVNYSSSPNNKTMLYPFITKAIMSCHSFFFLYYLLVVMHSLKDSGVVLHCLVHGLEFRERLQNTYSSTFISINPQMHARLFFLSQ